MRDLDVLNKYRVNLFGSMGDSQNGAFQIPIKGKMYNVIASNGGGWEHISVSNKFYTPTWDVMCEIKEMFFEDEEVVIQYHPKKSEYVNMHDRCLHLWRPIDKEIPSPNSLLVGLK